MSDKMTQPGASGDATQKKGIRWSRIVLVASLALNIAVLGIVGGALLRWDAGMDRAKALQTRDFGFGPFVGAFDTQERRALGRAFSRSAGDPQTARGQVREMFETMVKTLKTEPFDAAAFETLLLRQQKNFSDRQEIGARLVVDQIEAMSAEERMAYADRLVEALRRPPPRPRDGGAGGPHGNGRGDGPSRQGED
ncbi:periplasmic heavy metal sensor [Celeribacter sp. HF31]|uniref:periplasmic heavy metal sensor n=1 Tax=Celeribacter sp. HF31 TaxID=2721558 RepID=UPI00142FF8BA|nr:periplasmic heavy metal sensor [Celeribacter sp. HF31]NIY78204.1 periplasmic heavy metal sensor [Celeribacter sp. HF31]